MLPRGASADVGHGVAARRCINSYRLQVQGGTLADRICTGVGSTTLRPTSRLTCDITDAPYVGTGCITLDWFLLQAKHPLVNDNSGGNADYVHKARLASAAKYYIRNVVGDDDEYRVMLLSPSICVSLLMTTAYEYPGYYLRSITIEVKKQ